MYLYPLSPILYFQKFFIFIYRYKSNKINNNNTPRILNLTCTQGLIFITKLNRRTSRNPISNTLDEKKGQKRSSAEFLYLLNYIFYIIHMLNFYTPAFKEKYISGKKNYTCLFFITQHNRFAYRNTFFISFHVSVCML